MMINGMSGRNFVLRCAALGTAVVLSACGGGGGGSAPIPPTTYANTAASQYLPLAAGNTWTFDNASHITDAGAATITCSCAISGLVVENVDAYSPTSVYAGTFVYAKVKSSTGYR